jgi:hypothetical protein
MVTAPDSRTISITAAAFQCAGESPLPGRAGLAWLNARGEGVMRGLRQRPLLVSRPRAGFQRELRSDRAG